MKKIIATIALTLISVNAFASSTSNVTKNYDIPSAFKGCTVYEMHGGFLDIPMVAMSCPNKDVSNTAIHYGKMQAGATVVRDRPQGVKAIFINQEYNRVYNIVCQDMKGTLVCTKDN